MPRVVRLVLRVGKMVLTTRVRWARVIHLNAASAHKWNTMMLLTEFTKTIIITNFLSVGLFSHLLYLGVLGAGGHFRAFQHSPTTLQLCWFEELSAHQ